MKKLFRMMMAMAIATFTFTACEDVPEPYNNPYDGRKQAEPEATIDPAGSGTQADPWNVAGIIAACNGLGDGEFLNGGAEVYAKGIVTETTEVSSQFGNATYYISDDAKGSNRFYVYRGKLLDGASVTAETDLQVGDEVTVCGKVKNYKGTMEFDQGNYLAALKKGEGGGETVEAPGTVEKPLTVAEALTYIDGLGADKQSPTGYVKGKICAISEIDTLNYGNATYLISDDGTENGATLQIYRGYSLGGNKFKSADEIKVGYDVIVTGKLVNFKGNTKQFAQGSSIYSLNGKTSGGDTPTTDAKKVTIAEFNAAAESTEVWYELTGTVKNLKEGDLYGNFDLEDATGSVYVYGLLAEKGGEKKKFQELVAAKGIKEGSKLTIHGTRGSYNDKIEVMNAYFVSIDNSGSGDTPTPSGEVKKISVADFNAAAVSNDVWYELTGTVKNLKEGDIYGNFDLEDATGSVYVYGLLSEKGGEKKKFQDLVAAKGIKEGCTLTIHGNRGEYNGKIEVVNAYFVSIDGGDNPGGGGDNPGGGGEVSGNSITVNASDFGFEDKGAATQGTLADGTKIVFDKGEGKSEPTYYAGTYASIRIYAKNTVTITAAKTIEKVVITTTSPSGSTTYNGNDTAYAQGATKVAISKDSDTSVSFGGLNSKTVTIVNDVESGSGIQLRIASLTITYAE